MKEFFGIGGFQRPVEGYFSPQHLLFVSLLMVIMTSLAIFLGMKYKDKDATKKNKVIIVSAILIDSLELFKIIMGCITTNDPLDWLGNLPLFMCSIQLITIPLAAFSKGRIKEASLDFVFIFGLLGAVMGTYLAGNNYAYYPVFSFPNVVSGLTHSISGFVSLYIVISGMESMRKKNIPITFAIITSFAVMAYIANACLSTNYMFLVRGDGTPYDIIYNLVNGNPIVYPIIVLVLFLAYIALFYGVYFLIKNRKGTTEEEKVPERVA